MAQILKLTHADLADLSLLSGGNGLQLERRAWLPNVATVTPGRTPPPVQENLTCVLKTTAGTMDAIATFMQNLAEYQRYCTEYAVDNTRQSPVYLQSKLNTETGTRQCIVYAIDWAMTSNLYDGKDEAGTTELTITIERGPFYEDTAQTAMPVLSTDSGLARVWDVTSATAVAGDVRARVDNIRFEEKSSNAIGRIWCGWRSEGKHGDLTKFEPIWEVEDAGSLGTGVTGTDATASPSGGSNNKVQWAAVSSSTLLAEIRMLDIITTTADIDKNFGRFLFLVRAKVSAGTWTLRARFGYSLNDDDELVRAPAFDVSSTSWNTYEMGVYTMPTRDIRTLTPVNADDQYSCVQIWGKTAGAGTLDLDCVIPIPVDEGYAVIKNIKAGLNEGIYLGETVAGRPYAYSELSAGFHNVEYDVVDFGPRPGNNYLVLSWARDDESRLTDQIGVGAATSGWYDRWRLLRGAD